MSDYEFYVDTVFQVCFIWKRGDLLGWVEKDGTAHYSPGVRNLPIEDAIIELGNQINETNKTHTK